MHFAYDKFNNVEGATIPVRYPNILEKKAENSVKFKLYLHTSDEERVIKLCLSRIVNMLNKEYITTFTKILGESMMNKITAESKRRLPILNYLDESSRSSILVKIKTLPD